MFTGLFISIFFFFEQYVALVKTGMVLQQKFKLSHDVSSYINLYSQPVSKFSIESNTTAPFVAPLGWMQGIQYLNTECSGPSFVTTNIAFGVCIQDGDSSSYMQYMLLITDISPTTYEFNLATFSDATCTNLLTDNILGSMNPSLVCYLDNGNNGLSKTIYYYPGSTPPPYPYNGILTSYVMKNNISDTTCSGVVLKTIIMNPVTCFTNYYYNASDTYANYQSYQTQCSAENPFYTHMYSDSACMVPCIFPCVVPTSENNTIYENFACQSAVSFRQNGFPELYLLNDYSQFNYENAMASCYMGPIVFVSFKMKRTLISNFFHSLISLFREKEKLLRNSSTFSWLTLHHSTILTDFIPTIFSSLYSYQVHLHLRHM